MKQILKLLTIFSLVLVVFYMFLLSDFNPVYNDKEFVNLTDSLHKYQKNKDLNSIVNMYNSIHKKIKERRRQSEIIMNYIGPYRHGFSLTKKLYLLKVEKEFTQEDCLKFNLLNADFSKDYYSHNIIGIENAVKFYLKKEINELNEREIITLLIMLENHILYNPIRNPKGVFNKIRFYQNILHSNSKNKSSANTEFYKNLHSI